MLFLLLFAAVFFEKIHGLDKVAYNSGNNVRFLSNVDGYVDKSVVVVLDSGFLEFEANLDQCFGEVLLCYNSTDRMLPATQKCQSGFCGFWLKSGYDDSNRDYRRRTLTTVAGMDFWDWHDNYCTGNHRIRMQYWKTLYCTHYEVYSCAPKMDEQNRITIMAMKTSLSCQVTLLNAHIYEEPTTPAPTPPPTEVIEKAGLSTEWIIVICAIVVLILFCMGIGLTFAYLFGGFGYLKRKLLSPSKPKKQPSNVKTRIPMRPSRTITFTEDKQESQNPKTENAVQESAVAQTPEASAVAPSQAAATQKEVTKKEKVVPEKKKTAKDYLLNANEKQILPPAVKPLPQSYSPPPAMSKKAPEGAPKSEHDEKMKSIVASTTTQTEASVGSKKESSRATQKESPASTAKEIEKSANLVNALYDIFIAGQETTANTIIFAIIYALNYPEKLKKLHQELDKVIGSDRRITLTDRNSLPYCNAFIYEVQRLVNLLPQNLPHKLTKDVEIRGYRIPKNTVILPQVSSVLYDETVFPEPEKFIPERFLDSQGQPKKIDEFIPFSLGKRQCLGESLAKMELYIIIANFFNLYQISPSDGGIPPSMSKIPGVTIQPRPFKCELKKRY